MAVALQVEHALYTDGTDGAALRDAYLDAGALPTLHDRYGISTEALSGRVRAWLG